MPCTVFKNDAGFGGVEIRIHNYDLVGSTVTMMMRAHWEGGWREEAEVTC